MVKYKGQWFRIISLSSTRFLYKDEKGILGRAHNGLLTHNMTFSILLPRSSHFTHLIIRACHEKFMHNGISDTLTDLPTQFWVPSSRWTVVTVIAKCAKYRGIEGRSYRVPPPPPLSEFRVVDELAYSRVGIDLAGPLYVKDIYSN